MEPALASLIENAPEPAGDGDCYSVDGKEFARVTGIISKTMPPYLVPYAEKTGIQAAHAVYKEMKDSLPSHWEDTQTMARQMGLDCESLKNKGGDRGASVHFANQAWVEQGIPPSLEDFEPEHRPYAQTYCQFLMDYEPEFECSEVTVWNDELGCAGTFDAIATLTKRPKGVRHPDVRDKRLVLDYKTNKDKRVYAPQHYMQLAAYRYCLDSHGVSVDGEAVVAIGPSPWKNSGKPYTVALNYYPARLWPPVVGLYRALEEGKALNPRSRT